MGRLEWSWLFAQCAVELRDSTHEGREARLMILTIDHVPYHPPREVKGRSRKPA
jgi:hypothetical protein